MGYDIYCAGDRGEKHEGDYFNANISSMGWLNELMHTAGMLSETPPPGDWPDPNDPAYVRLRDQRLGYYSGNRIPWIKIYSTNDGWRVWPDEIVESLKAYDTNGHKLPQMDERQWRYWYDWVKFLQHTSEHEGFEVY